MTSKATADRLSVVVADDERNIRKTLRACLESLECEVAEAANPRELEEALDRGTCDLILLDLKFGAASGLELLPEIVARRPEAAVSMITAYATVETAVAAMKAGAADYLPKPFTPAQIERLVTVIRERRRLKHRIRDLEERLATGVPAPELETSVPAMRTALETLVRAAAHDVPILLRGENGTGKSLLARMVHGKSARAADPFVTVNCPTLSEELLASELFGHVRGAFTGAVRDQAGKVEAAEGGTLFLDEIGELSAALQVKLLRFLQDREYERVGETRTRRADVRVLVATNRDLDADVAAGRFREDLLYRVNTVEVRVPPLRDRRDDIPRLAQRFVEFHARATGQPLLCIPPDVEARLASYAWPGNVRELKNAIERASIFATEGRISLEGLPERIAGGPPAGPWIGGSFTIDEVERAHIAGVLATHSVQEEAARVLGIDSSTLWRKRKRQS